MALLTYLQIKAGGEDAPILFGEDTTQNNVGDTDVSSWLECSSFEAAFETGQQGAHSATRATARRVWQPARFVLRLGKSSPWLFEAALKNKPVDLTLHFFHRHHEMGVVEQNFQYRIRDGRITSIRLIQPNAHNPATASLAEQVELSVLPSVSEVESITGGTMMVDDWKSRGL
ncbi:MAG: type VI secretion system tube protein Hcp [Nitrospira sp.]|nr:type VI secretion system tube protein Hcp [Nitrospira sp.]